MKRLFFPAALLALFAFSWTPVMSQSSSNNDDVYYSTKSNTQDNTTTPAPAQATTPTIQPSNTYQNSQEGYGSYSNRYQNSAPGYSTVDSSNGGGNTIINNYYGPTGMEGGMCDPYLGFGYDPFFYPGFGLGFYDGFYPGFGIGLGFGCGFGYPYFGLGYGYGYPFYGGYYGEGFGYGYGGFASYYGPRRFGGSIRGIRTGGISRGRTVEGAPREAGNSSVMSARSSVRSTNVPFSRPSGAVASNQSAGRFGTSSSTRSAMRQGSYTSASRSNIPRSNVHNYYNGRSSASAQRAYASRGSFTPRGGFSSYQNNRSISGYRSSYSRSSGSFGGYRSSGSFSGASRGGGGFSGGGARGGGGGRR